MRRVHLIGKFPTPGAVENVHLCGRHLGSVIDGFPCDDDPGSQAFQAAQAAVDSAKSLGNAPANALVQTSVTLDAAAIWSGTPADVRALGDTTERLQQIVLPLADLVESAGGQSEEDLVSRTVTAVQNALAAVPAAVRVALHFSCRDGARYVMSPADMALMVRIANTLVDSPAQAAIRLHLPTPLRHDDDGYFRPLADLVPRARTAIFLGLVHLSDGVDGALRRAEMASRYLDHFGIGPRSDFAARAPSDIPPFLDLLRAAALQLDPH